MQTRDMIASSTIVGGTILSPLLNSPSTVEIPKIVAAFSLCAVAYLAIRLWASPLPQKYELSAWLPKVRINEAADARDRVLLEAQGFKEAWGAVWRLRTNGIEVVGAAERLAVSLGYTTNLEARTFVRRLKIWFA